MPKLINDVSTDLQSPPAFTKANVGAFPESFKETISSSYPDLKTLSIPDKSKKEVFDAVVKLAKDQPAWTLTVEDMDAGLVEGVATTKLLRFKDDFVVRIQEVDSPPEGKQVKVDMRSRSRIGKSDWGANAARIAGFFSSLTAAESKSGDSTAPPSGTA